MTQFQPNLKQLHQTLAWRPERAAGLDIEVAATKNHITAAINGQKPIRLSEQTGHSMENHARRFAAMLRHYPAPVTVNGQAIPRKPYTAQANIRAAQLNGDLMNPDIYNSSAVIQGGGRSRLMLDYVLYELGFHPQLDRDAKSRHSPFAYHVPDQQDGQPHFARHRVYIMVPNYRMELNPPGAATLDEWAFAAASGGALHRCAPPPNVLESMADAQLPPLRQDAIAVIRRHSGADDIGDPEPHGDWYTPPKARYRTLTNGNSLPLIVYGQPVTLDAEDELDPSTQHILARGLYLSPTNNLAPVIDSQPGNGELPNISCTSVTIVDENGQTRNLTLRYNDSGNDFTPDDAPDGRYTESGCQSIAAHLTVDYPDGDTRRHDLALDILCAGSQDQETVWLTQAWTPDRCRELRDLLCLAYTQDEDDDHYRRDRMGILATRLLQGADAAIERELQQTCDRLFAGQPPDGSPAAIIAFNPDHSLIWQPRPQSNIPLWLSAAVAAYNPEMDADAVSRQARSIIADPNRQAALEDILAT